MKVALQPHAVSTGNISGDLHFREALIAHFDAISSNLQRDAAGGQTAGLLVQAVGREP